MAFRVAKLFGSDGKMTYTGPREGSDLLDFVGPAKGVLVSGTKGMSYQEPKHPIISWTWQGADEGCEGKTIVTNKSVSGEDRGGQALERQTADILLSCGVFPNLAEMEKYFAQLLAQNPNVELDEDWLIKACSGRPCIVDIGVNRSQKTGEVISTIDNFITQAMYDEKKKTPGTFRQPRPNPPAAQQRGPVAPMMAGPNLGGVSAPGVGAPNPFAGRGLPVGPGVPGGFPMQGAPQAPGGFPGFPGGPGAGAPPMQPPPFAAPPTQAAPPVPNGGVPPTGQAPFAFPTQPGLPPPPR